MKHHIVVKFLAVLLCAACLLSAVGSGVGIIFLTATDLYERTVDDIYDEAISSLSSAYADQIASDYASKTLGGWPETQDIYNPPFDVSYCGYILKDAAGNVLEERLPETTADARYYTYPVQSSYRKLIGVIPESELYAATEPVQTDDGGDYLYIGVPNDTVSPVQSMSVTYMTGDMVHGDGGVSEGVAASGDSVLGMLSVDEAGNAVFFSENDDYFFSNSGTVTHVEFRGSGGQVIYEASSSGGVGQIWETEAGYVNFVSWLTPSEIEMVSTEATTAPAQETAVIELPTETAAPTQMPAEAPTEAPTEPEILGPSITDNIAKLGSQVACITIVDSEGGTHTIDPGVSLGKAFAYLFRNEDGTVTCRSYDAMTMVSVPESIHSISFLDAEGWLLYKVQSNASVGEFVQDGHLRFVTSVSPDDVVPAMEAEPADETDPTYAEPAAIADTTAVTEASTPIRIAGEDHVIAEVTDPTEATYAAAADHSDSSYTYYYDETLGESVRAEFIYEDMPETYTVELWLLPGAYELDAVYDLLLQVWIYRNELFYVLGFSLLLFAVFAVYLCCAAGKKPGRDGVRAGGLNSLSLDVYLAGGFLAICGLVILGFEGGYYLLRESTHVLVPFALAAGYAAALIIVGFCFACAAQFKTPGGYWWRNTLTVRCVKLGIRILRWTARCFLRFMGWTERFLGKLFPLLGRFLKFCWALVVGTIRWSDKGLTWLGRGIGKIAKRTHAWLHAFLSLLPVTWQWLLVGFGMLLLMALVFATNGEELLVVLCLGACVAIILYGAHCFGVLLDSTRRMGKGDLETKVDDKLMIGSFKEFASDLNALGDVAVIAAQKQLKSERMKTELITNVSHDIKTPLTSIINYVDLLQKPHTDEEQEVYLEVLARQSQQLKKLIEDLMEMSKASTGNMTVDITSVNAGEAVNQALGEFADKLEKAQLVPVFRQPKEPVYMQADGRLVWRVLSNILSNAVKYALPGTRVYIDLMELEGKVIISMKNISREELNVNADELLERFVRGDASRNTEGSGLGLNIAQSLMEIQKGQLQLLVDGDLFKVTLLFPQTKE